MLNDSVIYVHKPKPNLQQYQNLNFSPNFNGNFVTFSDCWNCGGCPGS